MRRPYFAPVTNRHLLRAGCQSERAVFRSHAGQSDAVDQTAMGVRLPHQYPPHAEDEPNPARRPRGLRRTLPSRKRFQRKPSWNADKNPEGRWRSFEYDELLKRDKVSLDVFWLKDEAQEDSANLPEPDIIAAEIAEDLRAALEQFETIAADLAPAS